jgi:glucose uptake protein
MSSGAEIPPLTSIWARAWVETPIGVEAKSSRCCRSSAVVGHRPELESLDVKNSDEMQTIIWALITVCAWGSWLAPSQAVNFPNQRLKTMYVTLANLILALVVASWKGLHHLDYKVFWLPFVGGLIWALSGSCAFAATRRIGIAKAMGLWAPLNIVVSMLWGVLLFGELVNLEASALVLALAAIILIVTGISLIISAEDTNASSLLSGKKLFGVGYLGALGAGILWGSYFIPLRISAVSMWVAALPMAMGMFSGSAILALLTPTSLPLERRSDYLRITLTGLLWGVGNYGSLRLMELIGTGTGFTIAQLGVVVNALIGIFWLKQPHPRTTAAQSTFIGVLLATLGAILLGNLK